MSDVSPDEEWRTVPEHADYDVSNLGRVRSWKRSATPQLLTNKPHRRLGYCFVRLDSKSYGVHQVVALAWHGPCPDGLEVDHINKVRNDNRPENLRYVTRQENLEDRRFHNIAVCINGHQMSGDNVYFRPSSGRRECRACAQMRREKRLATASAHPEIVEHGTLRGYGRGCRCAPCRKANADSCQRRYRLRMASDPDRLHRHST